MPAKRKLKDMIRIALIQISWVSPDNPNKVEKGFEQSLIDDKRKPLTVDGYLRNIRDFHKRLGIETLEDLQNISLDEFSHRSCIDVKPSAKRLSTSMPTV